MATKRLGVLAGIALGGALLLGTAGVALAQGPTTTPAPSPSAGTFGGMMGGQGFQGMMGGQGMGTVDMTAMHAAMGANGTCDPALMQGIHGRAVGR